MGRRVLGGAIAAMMGTVVAAVMVMAIAMAGAGTAWGVIKITFPVSRLYEEATVVVVGEVTRVKTGGGMECAVKETLKGGLTDETITVDTNPETSRELKAGQPAVIFINGDLAVIHVADKWRRAERKAGGPWGISGPYDMVKSYPGRTEGLAAVVRAIKEGKKGIQDTIGHEFIGKLVDWGNLGVKPTGLLATDVNGDGNMDLIVGTAAGARLFIAGGGRYIDATEEWGLKAATGKPGAAGDVNGDGKVDLLIGKTLWLREGERFVKTKATLDLPAEENWAAAMIGDVDGKKMAGVAVLTRTGELRTATQSIWDAGMWKTNTTTLWTGGREALGAAFSQDWGDDGRWYVMVVHGDDIVRYPVGAATAPSTDFRRLTGITLADYGKMGMTPMQVDLCVGLDYDGNGLTDLLVVTRGGGITMANRGFGTMLINGFMHVQFRPGSEFKGGPNMPKLPFEPGPGVFVAPGKRAGRTGKGNAQNLFLLRGDGELFEIVNAR